MAIRLAPIFAAGLAALAGCGGSDGNPAKTPTPTPTPAPTGITEVQANALPLNTPRAQIISRYGQPFDPRGQVPQKIIDGEPANVTRCDYYHVLGAKPKDFVQLCFRKGELQSKLSLIATDEKPTPVIPGSG